MRRIYCSGISTNAVVQAAVREGHDRDYEMVLLEDCCCALSAEEHESAIKLLQRFCRVTSSKDRGSSSEEDRCREEGTRSEWIFERKKNK